MVVGHVKRSRNETHNDWPNGGAVAVNWKCKLWTGVTHALFDLQPCNFDTRMRLLMPNNFYTLTFDLWPLDQPPFWIIWKTVKIPLLLGFLSNLQNNCLHMYFGPLRTQNRFTSISTSHYLSFYWNKIFDLHTFVSTKLWQCDHTLSLTIVRTLT